MAEVLVELPGGEGIIRGEDGAIEFTRNVREQRGQPLQPGRPYEPVRIWLADERCLVGGLLPPGAAGAEVVDEAGRRVHATVGGGAYARAAACAAAESETQVVIDGSLQPFLTLTTPGGSWVAVRHHDDLTIIVAGRDLDPASLGLEPIADPRARLLGPEPAES